MNFRPLPVLLMTLAFNTVIAVFLTVIWSAADGRRFGELLGINMVWSNSIGLCICLLMLLVLRAPLAGARKWLAVMMAVIVGGGAGTAVAPLLTGEIANPLGMSWEPLFIGVFFGAIASIFYWQRDRNAALQHEVEVRERARLEAEKRGIEAQLKMLQAQIEPHFLFNSLANVSSLIAADPALAGRLLDALIRYLRASLGRTRAEHGTLGDEVELLRAYLEVLSIRMGERLRYEFDIAAGLLAHPLPPMLLQPLVENAIQHGLEPKIEGGTLRVIAQREGDSLLLTVDDDGLGLGGTHRVGIAGGSGLGLTNVRARLDALFGSRGRLELSEKLGAGVAARIRLPAQEMM